MITLLAFGKICEVTGWSRLDRPEIKTKTEWKEWLEAEYPILRGTQYSIAINREISMEEEEVHDGSEIAFLPPFSGG